MWNLKELWEIWGAAISANTPWLVTGYGKYGLIFCTWRIWVMEKFEIRRGEAEPNFKFFHNPYSPSAEYERHIFHDPSPARGYLRLIPRQYMFQCNFILFTK